MQTNSFHTFQIQLGRRIQRLRKERGLSQEKMGALLGMDRVSIGYIEQGKRSPKLSTLYAMGEVFGIDFASFFDFEQPARSHAVSQTKSSDIPAHADGLTQADPHSAATDNDTKRKHGLHYEEISL